MGIIVYIRPSVNQTIIKARFDVNYLHTGLVTIYLISRHMLM